MLLGFAALTAAMLLVTVVVGAWLVTVEPDLGRSGRRHVDREVDPDVLGRHIESIVSLGPRDHTNLEGLGRVADYIASQLEQRGGRVERQPYPAGGQTYQNVVARFGPGAGPRVVVGAHYDTAGPLPGADDNASGVAALIELATHLGQAPPSLAVELVAYCLEEPPYFRTPFMGSAVHARSLADKNTEVVAMFSLEMLGYYDDAPGSQTYPLDLMRVFYPDTANFITVVSTYGQGGLGGRIKRAMKAGTSLDVVSITAPRMLTGVDFSDHANYWLKGFPAVMITDTSFYRNPHYHTHNDTLDTLDLARMARATEGVLNAVVDLTR